MVFHGPGTRCARQRTLALDGSKRRILGQESYEPIRVDRWAVGSVDEFFSQQSINLNFTCSQGRDEFWQAR